ncbi:MAG: hypothetical protein IH608_01030 [Proteobacteria bacterium]|nr:hypothetical protein [Pseudomonadota bacterium]
MISHLCGPEATGHTGGLRRFLDEDTPLLDIKAGDAFYTPGWEQKSIDEPLSDFEAEFARVVRFVRPLSDGRLSRKARIPMLNKFPLGEYPTLGQWVGALAEFHVGFHLEQLGKIRSEVGWRRSGRDRTRGSGGRHGRLFGGVRAGPAVFGYSLLDTSPGPFRPWSPQETGR